MLRQQQSRTRQALSVFPLLVACGLLCSTSAAQITFQRAGHKPLIPAAKSNTSWHGFLAANPVAIEFHNTVFLYARGIAAPRAGSTVGVWTAPIQGFDGLTWNQNPAAEPILKPDSDSTGIYDPSATVFRDKVYLYYGGYGGGGKIGLATSDDGLHFTKQGLAFAHGGTPFPVVNQSDGKLYLFYSRRDPAGTGWEYWVASSNDGQHFSRGQLAFAPTGIPGTFDNLSLITLRILYEAPYYYMTYGGSPTCIDYPEGIGLARSTDLIHWTRYPGNPILERGPAGTWDEAALWSGSVLKVNGEYYMWYEGVGTAAGAHAPTSIKARNNCYGGYGHTSWSQVGLAIAPQGTEFSNWTTPAKPDSSH